MPLPELPREAAYTELGHPYERVCDTYLHPAGNNSFDELPNIFLAIYAKLVTAKIPLKTCYEESYDYQAIEISLGEMLDYSEFPATISLHDRFEFMFMVIASLKSSVASIGSSSQSHSTSSHEEPIPYHQALTMSNGNLASHTPDTGEENSSIN